MDDRYDVTAQRVPRTYQITHRGQLVNVVVSRDGDITGLPTLADEALNERADRENTGLLWLCVGIVALLLLSAWLG